MRAFSAGVLHCVARECARYDSRVHNVVSRWITISSRARRGRAVYGRTAVVKSRVKGMLTRSIGNLADNGDNGDPFRTYIHAYMTERYNDTPRRDASHGRDGRSERCFR